GVEQPRTNLLSQSAIAHNYFSKMMSMRDPPAHDRLRALIATSFSPQSALPLRRAAESIVDDALNSTMPKAQLDVVSDLALDLPTAVTCSMCKIPQADWPIICDWTRLLTSQLMAFGQSPQRISQAEDEISAFAVYLKRLLLERSRKPYTNDPIS